MADRSLTKAGAFGRFVERIDAAVLQTRDDRALLEHATGTLTYKALGDRMRRLATAFAEMGLAPGDRVLIFSSDDETVVTLIFALMRQGLTPVLGDGRASAADVTELTRISKPAALFADRGLLADSGQPAAVRQVVELGSEAPLAALLAKPPSDFLAPAALDEAQTPQIALIVFTSGTTSEPKGVTIGFGAVLAQLDIFAEAYGFDASSRILNVLPLHHVDGVIRGPLSALWFGAAVLRPERFSPQSAGRLLAAVAGRKATHFVAVPAMLGIVMRLRLAETHAAALQTPDFRFVICSADYLEPTLWAAFEKAFGAVIFNAYGLSEVVCDALFTGRDRRTRRLGTLGRPIGCEVAVFGESGGVVRDGAVGELAIRGLTVMSGYLDAPEATAAVLRNGWFHTGDFVRRGGDGCFEFIGRKAARIVRAGVTVHPESITSAVLAMPGVAEAATFGVADGAYGEKIVCCAVPQAGAVLSEAEIGAFCRGHLAAERVPSEIHVLPALPRGASGKVAFDRLAKSVGATVAERASSAQAPGGADAADLYRVAAECFNVDASALSPDSTPFNTEGWDSLAHIALIEGIESTFGFEMSAIDIAGLGCLGDAEAIIETALEAPPDAD